jgi:hypothetical protein
MLGSELQKVAQQNMQAREEANFQNALYLNSLYKALAGSGLPESQIIAMLGNAYNMANTESMNAAAPTMATNPFVPSSTTNKKGQDELDRVITNAQNIEPSAAGLPLQAPSMLPLPPTPIAPAPLQAPSPSQAPMQSPVALPQVSLANINPEAFAERSPYVTLPAALAPNPVMAPLLPGPSRSRQQLGPVPVRLAA